MADGCCSKDLSAYSWWVHFKFIHWSSYVCDEDMCFIYVLIRYTRAHKHTYIFIHTLYNQARLWYIQSVSYMQHTSVLCMHECIMFVCVCKCSARDHSAFWSWEPVCTRWARWSVPEYYNRFERIIILVRWSISIMIDHNDHNTSIMIDSREMTTVKYLF